MASQVLPTLVPVGFFLYGKPEEALDALILIGVVYLMMAGTAAILMRVR